MVVRASKFVPIPVFVVMMATIALYSHREAHLDCSVRKYLTLFPFIEGAPIFPVHKLIPIEHNDSLWLILEPVLMAFIFLFLSACALRLSLYTLSAYGLVSFVRWTGP